MSRRSRLPGYVSRAIVNGGGGEGVLPSGERDWGWLRLAEAGSDTAKGNVDSGSYIPQPQWFEETVAVGSTRVTSPRSGRLCYDGSVAKPFWASFVISSLLGDGVAVYAAVGKQGSTPRESQGRVANFYLPGGLVSTSNTYTWNMAPFAVEILDPNEFVEGFAAGIGTGIVYMLSLALVEIRGSYGMLQESADGVSTTSGWQKIPGTTALYVGKNFSQSANNRLLYGGTETKKFRVSLATDGAGAPANQAIDIAAYKDGSIITGSSLTAEQSGNTICLRTHCFVELAPNSYVESWRRTSVSNSYTNKKQILTATELVGDYGLLYLTVYGGSTSGWAKVPGTTELSSVVNNFSQPVDNRLRYDGAVTKKFIITAEYVIDTAAGYRYVGIYKNAALILGSQQKIYPYAYMTIVSTQAIVELAQNDYVEAWGDVSVVRQMILSAMEVGQ